MAKQTELWDLPEVLVVHIKRFVFSVEDIDFVKVQEEVCFEKEMTISSVRKTTGTYDLYGVVHHYGSILGGHYSAEVRDLSNTEEESWFDCDDYHIKPLEEPEIKSSSAYLLFYWKRSEARQRPATGRKVIGSRAATQSQRSIPST